MKTTVTRIILPLLILMGLGLNTHASDNNHNLQEIKYISHPQSNRYGAGQPEAASFLTIAKAGIKHVINLRPPSETPGFNEAAIVTQAGMAYYNIPISGSGDLTRANVILIDKTLRRIGNEPALLHCSSSNRVGAVMALKAAWLEDATIEEAIAVGQQWGLTKLQPVVEKLLAQ
ncbi:hypothetical protein MNBD_GAMMA17-1382 [hydrothermal vent metagenome]|uniref:Protein tyrosine/serine phosphatase n=1 Tax=hydrothermal vent metagenome TaxID=652676 RepID=A0A3B0ZLV1_9ZZZZ